jgi:hypothetical protein
MVLAEAWLALQLFTHREDVDMLNTNELRALPGEAVTFTAQNSGPSPAALDSGCPVTYLNSIRYTIDFR